MGFLFFWGCFFRGICCGFCWVFFGVTESLFWGPKGRQNFVWGGGGLEDGFSMICFPFTFIVHNQKSNGVAMGGGGGGSVV